METQAIFSQRGKEVLKDMVMCFPEPILLIGDSGWGKSIISREASEEVNEGYFSINAHPGMDMALLVGMWRPESDQGGIKVVWEDGLLTKAIRYGMTFLFEELTRAPQEAVSRLHGVLDTANRYWSLPEAGESNVPVSSKFWFIATANPAGAGYQAARLEKALANRFIATFEINEPLADEEKVLVATLDNEEAVRKILKVADDARRNKDSRITTRDIIQWAEMIKKGFEPLKAFSLTVVPKFSYQDGLKKIAYVHFG